MFINLVWFNYFLFCKKFLIKKNTLYKIKNKLKVGESISATSIDSSESGWSKSMYSIFADFFEGVVDPVGKLVQVIGSRAIGVDNSLHLNPKVFDWSQFGGVSRVAWFVHKIDVVAFEEVDGVFCVMRRREIRPEDYFIILVIGLDERDQARS